MSSVVLRSHGLKLRRDHHPFENTTAIDLGLAYPNPVAVAVDPASQSMRRKRMTAPGTAREEHEAMEFSVKKSALQI